MSSPVVIFGFHRHRFGFVKMFKKFQPSDSYLQHIYSVKSNWKNFKAKFLNVLYPIVGDLARGLATRQAKSKFDPYGRPRFWGVSDFDRR